MAIASPEPVTTQKGLGSAFLKKQQISEEIKWPGFNFLTKGLSEDQELAYLTAPPLTSELLLVKAALLGWLEGREAGVSGNLVASCWCIIVQNCPLWSPLHSYRLSPGTEIIFPPNQTFFVHQNSGLPSLGSPGGTIPAHSRLGSSALIRNKLTDETRFTRSTCDSQ